MQDHLVNTSFNDLNDAQFSQFTDWAMSESLKVLLPLIMVGMFKGMDLTPQIQ